MKKKLFALILALSLLFTCAVPVFATSTDFSGYISDSDVSDSDISDGDVSDSDISDGDVSDSDVSDSDASVVDVKAVYDAVTAMETALTGDNLDNVRKAFDDFYDEEIDMFNEMNEAQLAELGDMKGCGSEEVFSWVLGLVMNTNIVINAADIYDAFAADPSTENANAYVDQYNGIFNDPEYVDEELRVLVRKFIPGIDEGFAEASKPKYIRISGSTRTATAVAISRASYEEADAVILTSGDNYADALAGVPLAYALDVPILFVRNHTLDADTLAEIKRLGAKEVYILGGEYAVGANVAKTLTDSSYKVTRIAGDDRFGTSLEIAKELQTISGNPSEIFFVYSHNYPDALAVSGIAAAKECPVIYIAATGKLTDGIAAFVKSSGATTATIISGPAIVNGAAEGNIKEAGASTVTRIYGENRYETCIKINKAYAEVLTGNDICVATGLDYPDALVGGVFAAINKAPLLLVNNSLCDLQIEYVTSKNADNVYVFGGTGVVSDELANEIAKY